MRIILQMKKAGLALALIGGAFLGASLPIFSIAAPSAKTQSQNFLRLYLMPSTPVKINWDTPRTLLSSTLNASLLNPNHPIGHVNIEVECAASPVENAVHFFAGAVSEKPSISKDLLLVEKVGFSILELGWSGRLEQASAIEKSIMIRKEKTEALSIVTFQISPQNCFRLSSYYNEYAKIPKMYYGFSPRPRYKEGSGCSAFAASFLEVAGILDAQIQEHWKTQRSVPLPLMAGYLGKERISLAELRAMPEIDRWANPEEPQMELTVFDPDQMHAWVKSLRESPPLLTAAGGEVDSMMEQDFPRSPCVSFDFRNRVSPHSPIFLSEPNLVHSQIDTVIRAGKILRENGSFELMP